VLAKIGQTPLSQLEQFLPDVWKREAQAGPPAPPRDPKDSPFLEMAIAASATHLITSDEGLNHQIKLADDVIKTYTII